MTDNRSNLCKILNVDYDEVFEFRESQYKIMILSCFNGRDNLSDYLCPIYPNPNLYSNILIDMINHSEEIVRYKRFTPQEIEDAKVLNRLFIFSEIYRLDNGGLILRDNCGDELCIEDDQFPSIKNGESYTYEEIIGGNY